MVAVRAGEEGAVFVGVFRIALGAVGDGGHTFLRDFVVGAFEIVDGFVGDADDVFVGLVFEGFFKGGEDGAGLFVGFVEGDSSVKAGPLFGGFEGFGEGGEGFFFVDLHTEKGAGGGDADDGGGVFFDEVKAGADGFF